MWILIIVGIIAVIIFQMVQAQNKRREQEQEAHQKEIKEIESIPLEFNMSWRYSTKSPCASSGGAEARYDFVTLKQGFSKQFYNGSVTM